MLELKANTAVDVLIGPFVDSTDGNTTEDALTISQADVKLSKNGQALAQKNDATACAFDDDGYYNCELDATDTNTEGQLVLIVHESGALPVRHEFNVLSEAAWDSKYAARDTGYMLVQLADAAHGGSSASFAFGAGGTISNASGDALALSSSGGNGCGLIATGNGSGDGIKGASGVSGTAGIYGLGQGTGAAGIHGTGSSTGHGISGTAGGSGTSCGFYVTSAATLGYAMYANHATAGRAIKGDITGNIIGTIDTVTTLTNWHVSVTDWTDGGRLDLILDAILDDTDLIDDGTSGLAKIATDVAAILEDTGTTIPGTITTMQGNVTDILADTNELQGDWANAGRLDTILDAILDDTDLIDDGTSGLAKIATDVAAILVDTGTTIPGTITTMQGNVTDILADTNELQTDDIPGTLATIAAYLDTEIAAILEDTGTTLPASIAALPDAAAINAEVVDALTTDTYAEPAQGTPAATTSIEEKISYLYKAWRNKSDQDATTYQLYNDDASTVDHKATCSDDGTTATKGEVASGP